MPNYDLKVMVGNEPLDFNSVAVLYRINQAPGVSITLNLLHSDTKLAEIQGRCMPGAKVNMTLAGKPLFSGSVVRWRCDFSGESNTVVVEAAHDLQKLKATYRSQLFKPNATDKDILTDIFKTHDIKDVTIEGMTLAHEQMVQFNCSDWRFMRARLNANGVLLVPTPTGVSILSPPASPGAEITKISRKEATQPAAIVYANNQLASGIEVSGWDIDAQAMNTPDKVNAVVLGEGGYDNRKVKALNNLVWQQGYSRALSFDEQRLFAQGRRLMNQLTAVCATLTVPGISVMVGQYVKLAEYGNVEGASFITGVKHVFNTSQWLTTLEIGHDLFTGMNDELVPPAPGMHIGIVAENTDGPDAHHALNITLPALLGVGKTLKARLSVPFASKESGFNFYPQKGDEVVVGFFEDDPRFPVIVGAMHNPKNKAPTAELDKGIGMVLKTGSLTQRLVLHPESGVLLEEKDGAKTSQLSLKAGVATLETSDDVKIDAGQNMQLDAGQKSTLTGNAGVEITGPNIALNK
ncbi:phage baseplate assembly protein V [Serratia marcescens]|uniref:phage baseplate assembly protein V n=1 Tax=Serratia marcescens TaxID=615 RepID=UPI003204D5B3